MRPGIPLFFFRLVVKIGRVFQIGDHLVQGIFVAFQKTGPVAGGLIVLIEIDEGAGVALGKLQQIPEAPFVQGKEVRIQRLGYALLLAGAVAKA